MNIHRLLSKKVQQALVAVGVPINYEAHIRQSSKIKFGDYQVNGIMAIAKSLNLSPYNLAKDVVSLLKLDGIAYKIDIVDPGFINIFLDHRWLENQLSIAISSPRLGLSKVTSQNIVIDYSAPNIAKEMHIGHLRSTIIGDAMVRTLLFLGHNVIIANHIGDWGTQFGMLIAYIKKIKIDNILKMQLPELENIYRAAKQTYDEDSAFAEKARYYVLKLQHGDKYCRYIWKKLVAVTMAQNQKIYNQLKVLLTPKNVMGESLYNNMLPDIVSDLKTKGIAVESEGATVVFLDEFKNKKGKPMGVIIQKKDGAYLYTTTDIACVKYRYETLKAVRIIYYTDSRQHQHLTQAWTIARKAGYIPESIQLEHHMIGMMLSKDGKPFKTRSGSTIKLNDLLDEALNRAYNIVSLKNPNMNPDDIKKIAQIVSIGSVKYSDLSKNRSTNYIFNWDNMLSLEGNTALYIQYAYARITAIFKRNNYINKYIFGDIKLESKYEIKLAVCLLQLEEAVITVARDGTPHILCEYLYSLAVLFSSFYKHCPILHAKHRELCQSRLQLAHLTARTLKQGLNLLGIETIKQI